MGRGRILLAVLGLLLIAGCAGTHQAASERVDVPARFSATEGPRLESRWWRAFQDPALNGLIEHALTNNPNQFAAWERLEQARALLDRESSDRLPSVTADAGARRTLTDTDAGRDYANRYDLGLTASYEIDVWGRIGKGVEASEREALARAEDFRAAGISLTASIATTWYRLIEERDQLELVREQLERNQLAEELLTFRFRRGQVNVEDVLRQRQFVERRRGDLSRAEADVAVLEHLLAVLLGENPGSNRVPKEGELASLPDRPNPGIPLSLLRRRPDLRAQEHRIAAADADLAVAIADTYPTLDLLATFDYSDDELSELFDDWQAALIGSLVGPIIDGGRRRAEVSRQRSVVAEEFHQYRDDVLSALAEVEDALVQEEQHRELLTSLEKQLELSGQIVRQSSDNYMKGNSDYLRVIDALTTRQDLQRTVLQTRRELIEYRIDLCRALAGGWALEAPGEDSE